MVQVRKCTQCGNAKQFYMKANIVTEVLMEQEDDGTIGFVTDEDDTSNFLRINFKSANSTHNGVHIIKYEEPLRCSTCHNVVPF